MDSNDLALRSRVLTDILADFSDILDEEKKDRLIRFYDMLVRKNEVMNLTAITEFTDVAVKHFADSLSIAKIMDISGKSVIDVGTGAGFPGIPLAICFPEARFTLLDSLNKRLVFIDEVIAELGLKGIKTVHARAEEGAHSELYREKFDLAVSRAVANLSTLVEYCMPFVKVGGTFVSYKGPKASEELEAAEHAVSLLGGGKVIMTPVSLSCMSDERNLLSIPKVKKTPGIYPRSGGKPSKEPLV